MTFPAKCGLQSLCVFFLLGTTLGSARATEFLIDAFGGGEPTVSKGSLLPGTNPPFDIVDSGDGFVHFVITEVANLPGVIPQLTRSRDFLTEDGEFLHRLLVTLTPNSPEIDVQFTSTEGDLPMGVSHFDIEVTADDGFLNALTVSGHLADSTGFSDTILVRSNFPVPEPASIALLGAGLLGLSGFAARRRARA